MIEGRTIQIRGVDPEVASTLERYAAADGVTLSAFLREQLAAFVHERRELEDWWASLPAPVPGFRLTQEDIDELKAERDRRPEWE